MQAVLDALRPVTDAVAKLDLSDPAAAQAALEAALPFAEQTDLRALLLASRGEGLTPRKAGAAITFGRLSKPVDATSNLSIDVVDIEGAGMEHTHPEGEVSLCIATDGDPRFDGNPEGWVIYGPDSHHTPTVTGGRMLIVYFSPNGAVKWGPR